MKGMRLKRVGTPRPPTLIVEFLSLSLGAVGLDQIRSISTELPPTTSDCLGLPRIR